MTAYSQLFNASAEIKHDDTFFIRVLITYRQRRFAVVGRAAERVSGLVVEVARLRLKKCIFPFYDFALRIFMTNYHLFKA